MYARVVVVAVLVMHMLYFLISSSTAAPPNTTGRERASRGFSVASFSRGLSGPPLGPRQRHGNWSDVADEAEYGGAREGERVARKKRKVGEGRCGKDAKRVRRPAFHGACINYTKPRRCYARVQERDSSL